MILGSKSHGLKIHFLVKEEYQLAVANPFNNSFKSLVGAYS